MSGLEVIPETAKALSAPVTKLVEVIAAGCGRLYKPTDIRRTATAEGDALVIMEEARIRASEVATRAAQRLMDTETRRQENLEAISYKAEKELPPEVSPTPVEEDWARRFFREAQDVSNEQMQTLWAKLLAGEVAKPGTFSARTLAVVASLSPSEAALFKSACGLASDVFGSGSAGLFVYEANAPYLLQMGLGYSEFARLQAAGLLTMNSLGQSLLVNQQVLFVQRPDNLLFCIQKLGEKNALNLGKVGLTPAGEELRRIVNWESCPDHDGAMQAQWSAEGWNCSRHLIIERLAEGNVRFTPAQPDPPPAVA